MKTTLITFIVSLFAFITTDAIVPSKFAIEEKKPIELDGKDNGDRGKSLIVTFEAWQTNNEVIEIVSFNACTDVTISICTINGQVLDSQTLSFTSMQSFTFNIGNYTEGYYLVKINTPTNTEYSGTFMIE